jgi:RimJ/RimL family protein N-acetyltransferase
MNAQEKIIFRSIEKEDVDQLYELLNELPDKAKSFFHPHKFDKETINDICVNTRDHYFVLIIYNKIIGYSFLRLFGYKIPSFGCCIHHEYWGKGYGETITKKTIEMAKKIGYPKVILKVYKKNNAAFNLYKKIGFKVIDENLETDEYRMEILFE